MKHEQMMAMKKKRLDCQRIETTVSCIEENIPLVVSIPVETTDETEAETENFSANIVDESENENDEFSDDPMVVQGTEQVTVMLAEK